MIVGVIIPFLEDELSVYLYTLKKSLETLNCHLDGVRLHYIFIPQPPKKPGGGCDIDIFNKVTSEIQVCPTSVVVIPQDVRSVSMARNKGILCSIHLNCTHIYFHDISIRVTSSFAKAFLLMDGLSVLPFAGAPKFVTPEHLCSIELNEFVCSKPIMVYEKVVYPAFNPYVWSYIFPLSLISNVRFDESIGPGDTTALKAGEDYLFLSQVLSKCRFKSFASLQRTFVLHSVRMISDEKYLVYAKGQGYACRTVLLKYKRPIDLLYAILFFGNSIVNFILFKKDSAKIFVERLRGFFGFI